MDFDAAWCPACDRQIQPKRYTISVPVTSNSSTTTPPPPPPSSPRKTKGRTGGLVNGTGRLRHNGTIKPAPPAVVLKQRLVIDQGPIPLYCSDECQIADLSSHRREEHAPLDPAREEPANAQPLSPSPPSSADKFVQMYNLPALPPPMPTFDEEATAVVSEPTLEYTNGIIMAGRLISSLCPPPAPPHTGKYKPAREPRQPIPGWNDGSNAWRAAVYSTGKPKNTLQDPFLQHRRGDSVTSPSPLRSAFSAAGSAPKRTAFTRKAMSSCSLSLASAPATFHHAPNPAALMSKFSENFIRRSESRVSLFNPSSPPSALSTATPSSPVSTHSMPLPTSRREKELVHPNAKGKLLVPDVKLRMRGGSASSVSSASLSSAWSGPSTVASSSSPSRSARSPLSAPSDSDEDTERCDTILPRPRRPVETTRSWSYDNVKTYDMMPIPLKKVKKMEKRIVDGVEVEEEVEVEVYEEPKRLFLFAPTRISE
ncbi:hypothetical protein JR316_0006911 [Psilocybe cubensis]|uniref:Uncharacterized protein n=2 Tax=Psilocybe cubensis TaxID=181762 RepID=A0A8H8CML1_PSICU|nr:hypothetical protein JR316_0006911 [Psilocybe cubensis]KAH9480313.1 hypothetical protein JR316_0006911 [Psilocybe cubensis]